MSFLEVIRQARFRRCSCGGARRGQGGGSNGRCTMQRCCLPSGRHLASGGDEPRVFVAPACPTPARRCACRGSCGARLALRLRDQRRLPDLERPHPRRFIAAGSTYESALPSAVGRGTADTKVIDSSASREVALGAPPLRTGARFSPTRARVRARGRRHLERPAPRQGPWKLRRIKLAASRVRGGCSIRRLGHLEVPPNQVAGNFGGPSRAVIERGAAGTEVFDARTLVSPTSDASGASGAPILGCALWRSTSLEHLRACSVPLRSAPLRRADSRQREHVFEHDRG